MKDRGERRKDIEEIRSEIPGPSAFAHLRGLGKLVQRE